jgi:hypothetical protein
MRDDVRAGDTASDGAGVPDIRLDEISSTRPAFRSVPGDPYDIVTLAQQSGGETTAEHATGPGDRDSH